MAKKTIDYGVRFFCWKRKEYELASEAGKHEIFFKEGANNLDGDWEDSYQHTYILEKNIAVQLSEKDFFDYLIKECPITFDKWDTNFVGPQNHKLETIFGIKEYIEQNDLTCEEKCALLEMQAIFFWAHMNQTIVFVMC